MNAEKIFRVQDFNLLVMARFRQAIHEIVGLKSTKLVDPPAKPGEYDGAVLPQIARVACSSQSLSAPSSWAPITARTRA